MRLSKTYKFCDCIIFMVNIVILDTDFILASLEFRVDIFSELNRLLETNYEVCVVDKTIEELKGKKNEKLAASLLEKVKVLRSGAAKNADEAILKIADHETMVATQDKALKEKLKKRKIGVITIRQKRYLVLED